MATSPSTKPTKLLAMLKKIVQTVEIVYDIIVHVELLGKEHPEEGFVIDRQSV